MHQPVFHAVVAVSAPSQSWVTTPPLPWPPFVRLSSESSDTDVALVVHVLATYNASKEAGASVLSPEALVRQECLVLPGGLAVLDGDMAIYPSCCAGLEEWPEWASLLSGSGSPFLGHDPAPLILPSPDGFLVWSDGGMDPEIPASAFHIAISRQQLSASIAQVRTDLLGFLLRLRAWSAHAVPSHAAPLVSAFANAFHIPLPGGGV